VPIERVEGLSKGELTGRCFIRIRRIRTYSESCANKKKGYSHYNPSCPVQTKIKYFWKAADDA
jgi:hypothetical protein